MSEETVEEEIGHLDLIFEDDDDLAHFGVKGMKWGVRKDRSSGGSGPSSSKTDKAKAAAKTVGRGAARTADVAARGGVKVAKATGRQVVKEVKTIRARRAAEANEREAQKYTDPRSIAKLKKQDISGMTTQDLQALIYRMNLEKQYAQAVASSRRTSTIGKGAQWAGEFLAKQAGQQANRVGRVAITWAVDAAIKKAGYTMPSEGKKKKKE